MSAKTTSRKSLCLIITRLSLLGLLLLSSQWLAMPAHTGDPDDLLVKSFGNGFGPDKRGGVILLLILLVGQKRVKL